MVLISLFSPPLANFLSFFLLCIGIASFESVYGTHALRESLPGVRMITAAPEIDGVISAMGELTKRGIICSIGHRYIMFPNMLHVS